MQYFSDAEKYCIPMAHYWNISMDGIACIVQVEKGQEQATALF